MVKAGVPGKKNPGQEWKSLVEAAASCVNPDRAILKVFLQHLPAPEAGPM